METWLRRRQRRQISSLSELENEYLHEVQPPTSNRHFMNRFPGLFSSFGVNSRTNEAEIRLPTSWNSVKDRPSRVSGQGKVTGSSSRTEQPCQDGGVARVSVPSDAGGGTIRGECRCHGA